MSNTNPNRKPAGSKEGGRFAPDASGKQAPETIADRIKRLNVTSPLADQSKTVSPVNPTAKPQSLTSATPLPGEPNGGMLTSFTRAPSTPAIEEPSADWPQANQLEKVAATTVAVQDGACTASTIAESLGVVERQGAYYAAAAEGLGLIERIPNTSPAEYQATEFGEDFIDSDTSERSAILASAVSAHPGVKAYRDSGEDESMLLSQAEQSGLSPETAGRRVSTIRTWSKDSQTLENKVLSDEWEETRERAVAAAERARKEREEAKTRTTQPVRQRCDIHNMEFNGQGFCDDCDAEA